MTTGLAVCDECGIESDPDDLYTCALSVPWAQRHECAECSADCSPCRSEAAAEFNAEHYGFAVRRR